MYGQGNYAPQFGQDPQTSVPPIQQHFPGPPPPPFQQGPPAPRSHTVPSHVNQPGPPVYPHAPRAPVQRGPPVLVPPSGMLNSGQSYFTPPPPPPPHPQVHVAHSYSTAQQNSVWTQSVHHIPPPVPPPIGPPPTGPSFPEMLRPPPAPRVLPPPPSQGQALYIGLQHTLPPPPPPPTSSFFTPAPFGSFVHSASQHIQLPTMDLLTPPPPPSSPPGPPPLPPSSPPPTSPPPCFGTPSSATLLTASDSSHHSESGPSSNQHSDFEVRASDSVNTTVAPHQINEGGTGYEGGSLVEHGSSGGNLNLDLPPPLPPPPPKPTEEKIVRKIEVLCQYIAKNGPGFEDVIRQKEFGNPEFGFLIGGESGSEAAAAHKYFVWMKKKCSLACKLNKEQQHSDSPLRSSLIGSSLQPDSLMGAGVSHSPVDSDMDMEDDITQPNEEQQVYTSFGSLNHESDLISNELDTKEQLHAPQSAAEHSLAKDAISGNLFCSRSAGLVEQGKGPNISPHIGGATEWLLDSNIENSSICQHEDLSQSNASAAAAGFSSEEVPSQLIKGASPFRLLQDYASDESSENDEEPCLEDVSPAADSPSVKAGTSSLDGDMVFDFQTDLGSKSLLKTEKGFGPFSKSVVTSSLGMPSISLESSIELQRVVRKTDVTSIASGKAEQLVDNSHGNQESVDSGVDAVPESGKSQKEDAKYTSTQLKVDEFGRMVREGASDSDSDDLVYPRRRGKRDRSWSRSRSPHDRRRRSPWRRKDKRSRSRSWSPKKRRSRSKSPPFRRGGEFGGDRTRRDKGQLPECFDFRRGKCYRGALCRYLHHDSDKSDGSRRYKSKLQYQEVPPSSKSLETPFHEHDEVKSQEMQLCEDVPGSSFDAPKDGNIDQEKVVVSARNAGQPLISDQDGDLLVTAVAECEMSQEVTGQVQEAQDKKEEVVEPTIYLPENESCLEMGKTLQHSFSSRLVTDAEKLPSDTSHGKPSSFQNSVMQQSQADPSDPVLQNANFEPQQMDESSASEFSPVRTSTIVTNELSTSGPHPNQISSIQSFPGTGSMSKPYSPEKISSQSLVATEFSPHIPCPPSQLPPPPSSVSQGTNAPLPPQLPTDYNMIPPSAKYPSHSASAENFPPYQAPLPYQHSHFSVPPNSSWNSLPPPPPRPPYVNDLTMNAATAPYGVPSLQFQQNQLPPKNDFLSQTFVRPYPTELAARSQVGDHRTYPPMLEPGQPLSDMEDLRPRVLPVGNPMTQQFGGPGLVGEDRFTRLPVQGLISSNSFGQGNMHPQSMPFSRESPARRMQSFSGNNLPPVELITSSSQDHHYLQQPFYGLQRPVADSISVDLGEPGMIDSTRSRYASDFLDRNQPSRVSDFGGSRIPNYYNPYASTFDQPLSSKFTSNVFNQEKDLPYSNKYGAPFSLSHAPVDGHVVGTLGSRNVTSSPNSAHPFEQILLRSGGDQYDPIFDSIEPSSNSFRKSNHGQKRETTDDSDIMLRLSGSNKPLDVEENKKQKEAGDTAASTSLENDEYGETADAEVGAVENGSPSDPNDMANTAVGEIEIDQVKTPGRSKKSKDSRSMKLFKVALADFVKEVLKPSWRQGNMSKEAFKTIVKKTVDKVSGAMKSHQIPKSQAKIDQYIDSSQRKLTKLVMGYVDKYVKV